MDEKFDSNIGKIAVSLGLKNVDSTNYSDLNPEQKEEHIKKLIKEQNNRKEYTENVDGMGKIVVVKKRDSNEEGEVIQFSPKEG